MDLSYSKISLFTECPRKFKFAYVDKIAIPENRSMLIGSALHWLLQRYYSKIDIVPEHEFEKEIIDVAQRILEKYIQKYKLIDDFKTIDHEVPFTFKRNDITWNGKIDLVIEKDNKLYIVDHKYSSRKFIESFMALNFQGVLYYYYYGYVLGKNVTGIIWNTISCPNKLLKDGSLSTTLEMQRFITYKTDKEVNKMWQTIDEVVEDIQNEKFIPHISRQLCEYCPYIEECIIMQKGLDESS